MDQNSDRKVVDLVPSWKALWRTLHPLRTISDPALWGPFSRAELLDHLHEIQRAAQATALVRAKSVGIWKMERLGYSFCRDGEQTLRDPTILRQALPILHIGLGVTASERAMFVPEVCLESIERQAHPGYREFALEAMGAMWALYANRRFQFVFRQVSRSDLARFELPAWNAFTDPFSPEVRRLISHGVGRTLYFQHRQVFRAIRDVIERPGVEPQAATQGVAFAYLLLNYQDFYRILDIEPTTDRPLVEAFSNGLIYAIAFLSWTYPGFAHHLIPRSDLQARRIEAARELIDESRRLGRLITLGLSA